MRRATIAIWAVFATVVASGVTASSVPAAQSKSKIKANVENSGVLPDATGSIVCAIKEQRSKMTAKFRNLAPGTTYDFVVGGIPQATFTTSSSGSGKALFLMPEKIGKNALDFDPRGEVVTVEDAGGEVLHTVLSGAGEPGDIQVDERVLLGSTGLDPDGKAEARFRSKDGRRTFKVEIEDVAAGAYDLFVGGVLRAVITVDSTGEGEVEFDSEVEPGKLPLDFDPRGQSIDVSQGPNVFFSASLAAPGQGVTECTFSESEQALASTGVDPDASGKARFRVRDDCDQDFRVEIEDVPVGAYDLLVDGVNRGTITVADTGVEIEGEIEFDTDPDDPGDVLLDFDPRGALIEVVQGATTYFSSAFDGIPTGGPACTPTETELPLLNVGPDGDASGKARFRVRDDCDRDFRVEIEDLPLGSYDLLVDGTNRGTITVVDTGLEIEGEIEFDTDPDEPGEVLLTFDPGGKLVEIEQGGTTFLSRIFDAGAGGGGPGTCTAFDQEPDLVNVGPDGDAKGKARFREEADCDADFRVEIEDLPLGDYDLLVGGVHRGTISVVLVLGEPVGEIEFDNDPDQPGEVLLTFDPRGQLVEIEQGGTVFLSLTFPAS